MSTAVPSDQERAEKAPQQGADSGSKMPVQTGKGGKRKSWLRTLLKIALWACLLVLLLLGLLWWQRIPLAQWAVERYFQSQSWQATVEFQELDFARGARLNLSAEREGASLLLEDVKLDWQWRLSQQEQVFELLGGQVNSAEFHWNQALVSAQELASFGQGSQQQEQEQQSEAGETEADVEDESAEDAPKQERFAIAPEFAFSIDELELEVQAKLGQNEKAELSGQTELQASWQSALDFQLEEEQFKSWQLTLSKPAIELSHQAYGKCESLEAETFVISQSPEEGITLDNEQLSLQLSSLPAASPFSQLEWKGKLGFHLSPENTQALKLAGALICPERVEWGLSSLKLQHKLELRLIERQLEEATAVFFADDFLWNEQALRAQAQTALIWEQGALSALSLGLQARDPAVPDSPWKLQLNGAGQEQQGILNFLLTQGMQRPLTGEGTWNQQRWKLGLEGQVPLTPRWFAPLLQEFIPPSSPLQAQLTESSLLRLQKVKLGGDASQLQYASGQAQVRDLAIQLDDYDAGWATAEADLNYLPEKGVLFRELGLNLPALQARGALLLSLREREQSSGQARESAIDQGQEARAGSAKKDLQLKGWGWQIQLHELGPVRQYHPALETLDAQALLQDAFLSLEMPRQEAEHPQLHFHGQLAQAELSSFEPLFTLSGIRAPKLSFFYGNSPSKPEQTESSRPRQKTQLSQKSSIRTPAFWQLRLPVVGIAEANIQDKLKLHELRSSFQVRPQELALEGLQLKALKGQLSLDAARIPLPKGEWTSTLRWEEVDLAQIAALIPNFEGSMEGRIDGYLPLAFEGFELKKEFQGGLSLTPGFQARMSAKPQGILELGGHPRAAEAEAILADYLIREFDGVLLPAEDQNTLMRLKFRGEGGKTPGELALNIPVTTDQPELVGSILKWVWAFLSNLNEPIDLR